MDAKQNKITLKLAKFHIIAMIIMPLLLLAGFSFVTKSLLAEEETVESGANEDLISDLNRQIDEQRQKIDELASQITEHQNSIKGYQKQALSLKNQVSILDNQIGKAELDIKAKEQEMKIAELEIEKIGLEIKDNQDQIERQKEYLGAFIRLLDYYDDKDYLSVLLNNNSFAEFFDQINNIEGIEKDMQKTLNRFQELLVGAEAKKKELDEKRTGLSELLNSLDNQKTVLQEQVADKGYLIKETKNSEVKFQGLIIDLKKAQAAANNAVGGLERQLRQELEKRGENEKFNNFGDASLIWPLASRRITAYFHDPDYPYRNLFEHSGLDLGVPSGTAVAAAEAGYVAKVAINTKWYGTYIMIIHSNNLATLYAHLSSAAVSADQYVSRGQTIGASGNTGFSSGPHLHFEVRSGGIPVNPLNYLP